MKKLVTLLAAAGMVVAASAPASAVDVKVDARYRFSFMTGETGFQGANKENVLQRLRLGLTMAASENLSGYANFQIGKTYWGTSDDTNGKVNGQEIQARMVYIDWKVPGTAAKVRMGRQQLGLPADAFGHNAVMAAGWGTRDGIVVTSPVTDWLGMTALWARLGYDNASRTNDLDENLSNDFFAAAANLKFDGISGSVYAAYAAIDGDAANTKPSEFGAKGGTNFFATHGNAWWIGATATLSYFDPFTLKLSAAYGSYEASDSAAGQQETAGWNVQAKASYKTSFGTPVLGAWYFSGYDEDGDGLMPSMTGYFTPTRTWNDAAKGLNGGQAFGIPTGNWGVQLGIEKVSFVNGLTHDFLVSYIEGTNDKDLDTSVLDKQDMWLTEEDSLVEFDFISTYQIYKNLAAHLELSYIISDIEDRDNGATKLTEDDWRAELTFEYKF